jgi:hypothetical protein
MGGARGFQKLGATPSAIGVLEMTAGAGDSRNGEKPVV